jgi:hypothetical protein
MAALLVDLLLMLAVETLDAPRWACRDRASRWVERCGEWAVPHLERGLSHPSLEVQRRCELLLAAEDRRIAVALERARCEADAAEKAVVAAAAAADEARIRRLKAALPFADKFLKARGRTPWLWIAHNTDIPGSPDCLRLEVWERGEAAEVGHPKWPEYTRACRLWVAWQIGAGTPADTIEWWLGKMDAAQSGWNEREAANARN